MTTYTVHVYREMRLVYSGIAAASIEQAARIACQKPTNDAEEIECAEGWTFSALVDVDGDSEYEQSRCIDTDDGRLVALAPEMLRFLSDFVAFGYAPSSRDHWDGMGQFLEHARRLLRQSKGRRPA